MNIALLGLVTILLFVLAYYVYGGYIAKKIGVAEGKKTPARLINDKVDYVPTHPLVLFGHHFAAIAGAGPIVGPTVALLYGYIPVWLWVVVGVIFFGAVHDFVALFVSVREGGKSMAEVAGRTLGKTGFLLFICFTIMMIVLVTSAFLGLTSKALTSLAPLSTLNLGSDQKLLHTVVEEGVIKAKIGGIASTSVIFMTIFAPLIGFLLYRKHVNVWTVSLIATLISIFSIMAGFIFPVMIDANWWMIILSVYVFLAAGIPVWIILQPRDFTNAHILYAGLLALVAGITSASLKGLDFSFPAFNIASASGHSALGPVWPVLFITVACGAISGFHALVAGGTSAKQLKSEKDARLISFGAMLLEAVVAVCVIITVATGLKFTDYLNIVFPAQVSNSNPILAFSLATGNLLKFGLNIPPVFGTILGILLIEGFVITSLDCAVRLNRYLFEELWSALFKETPRFLKSYYFNSGLAVALMLLFAFSNAYLTIWPIFGTANQLLAALTLIAVSAWLLTRGKQAWFVILPALFMIITTFASLLLLLFTKYLPTGNYTLIAADVILLALSFGVAAKAAQIFQRAGKGEYYNAALKEEHEEDFLAKEMHIG
jgi:carbon starvation protein